LREAGADPARVEFRGTRPRFSIKVDVDPKSPLAYFAAEDLPNVKFLDRVDIIVHCANGSLGSGNTLIAAKRSKSR
jgi:hypothetical protein